MEGAACMAATVANPDWADAYANGSVGGLIGAVLAPAGGFGKFCLVLLAFPLSQITFLTITRYFPFTMAQADVISSDCLLKSLETGQ